MATKKTEKVAREPGDQVTIRLTDEVHLAEWNQYLQPGQEMTVSASLLTDGRIVGKFEEV